MLVFIYLFIGLSYGFLLFLGQPEGALDKYTDVYLAGLLAVITIFWPTILIYQIYKTIRRGPHA